MCVRRICVVRKCMCIMLPKNLCVEGPRNMYVGHPIYIYVGWKIYVSPVLCILLNVQGEHHNVIPILHISNKYGVSQ
jgi:hypothetical protein